MKTQGRADGKWKFAYLGIGLVTGATLMLQIALTRVFSVVMWYHMSLVSISMAMFGMTLGALIVEWRKADFAPNSVLKTCSKVSLVFGVSICISMAVCLNVPFVLDATPTGFIRMFLWNSFITLPFILSGIIVCAILTRFPPQTGKLYSADLAGAALGCLSVVWLLNRLDAPSAILALGALGAFASAAFALAAGGPHKKAKIGLGAAIAILCLSLFNNSYPLIRVRYVLGEPLHITSEQRVAGFEREFWNVFSYVLQSQSRRGGLYWGAGANAKHSMDPEFKVLLMDTRAGTNLIRFDGRDWNSVRWLLDDATNIAYRLRRDGRVLVIGVGGGRDILSALIDSSEKRYIDGVDINPRMIGLLSNEEREFTGGIAALPNVSLFVDEARSWVARTDRKYQVITIPLVDTSAASSAGAYALTENNLYTQEAFDLFLRRLTPDGVLSVSRWWWEGRIGEGQRLTHMAAQALRKRGVSDPGRHMIAVRGSNLLTLLVATNPFTAEDLARLTKATRQSGFEILHSPAAPTEGRLSSVIQDPEWPYRHPYSGFLNLYAATDDQPFFFHFFRLGNVLSVSKLGWIGVATFDLQAMLVLSVLIWVVCALAAVVLAIPLFQTWRQHGAKEAGKALVILGYFSAIGLGFMLFESTQIQRLNIFLGYPVYALTVVLFTLLLFSSFGSFFANRIAQGKRVFSWMVPLCLAMLMTLGIVEYLTLFVTERFAAASTAARIFASVTLMIPPSFLMGMFFPLGLHLVSSFRRISPTWCWVANGMMSTCAAVFSVALSITFGFSFTFMTAAGCYAAVGVCCLLLLRWTGRRVG